MGHGFVRVEFSGGRCDGKVAALPLPVPGEYHFLLPRDEDHLVSLEARRWGVPGESPGGDAAEMVRARYLLAEGGRYRFDREEPCP